MMTLEILETLKRMKVLFAEDESTSRMVLRELLKPLFNEVIEAKDGQEALELYKKHNPDLLFLDITMPKMNGLDVLRVIRDDNSDIGAIVITAHTDKHLLLEAVELKLEKYLLKPIDKESFYEALERCAIDFSKRNQKIVYFSKDSYYNHHTKELFFDGEYQKLTKKEYLLLELLIERSGQIVEYKSIESVVWQGAKMASGSLRSLVKLLRKKIPSKVINNVSGIGYKMTF